MIGLSLIVTAALGLMVAGCKALRSGYETAPYRVVRTDGAFELRDYPALMVVKTRMGPNGGADGSFNRLFRFITGNNDAGRKISMTTPVFMSDTDSNRTMAFVMPATLKPGDVPKPSDGAVAVQQLATGRFAVLRFKGGRNPTKETSSLGQLQAWMKKEGLGIQSTPVYAYFDPPWTPGFLRRNEVMLRISP